MRQIQVRSFQNVIDSSLGHVPPHEMLWKSDKNKCRIKHNLLGRDKIYSLSYWLKLSLHVLTVPREAPLAPLNKPPSANKNLMLIEFMDGKYIHWQWFSFSHGEYPYFIAFLCISLVRSHQEAISVDPAWLICIPLKRLQNKWCPLLIGSWYWWQPIKGGDKTGAVNHYWLLMTDRGFKVASLRPCFKFPRWLFLDSFFFKKCTCCSKMHKAIDLAELSQEAIWA